MSQSATAKAPLRTTGVAFKQFEFLTHNSDVGLDNVCAVARSTFNVEGAFVTLIQQAGVHIVAPAGARGFAGRGFCAEVAGRTDVVTINAAGDARFDAYPAPEGRPWVFYAGMAIVMPGREAVAALCLLDTQPRVFSDLGKERLKTFAVSAAHIFRRERENYELRRQVALLRQGVALAGVGCWEIDHVEDRHFWSEEMYRIHGFELGEGPTPGTEVISRIVTEEDRDWTRKAIGDPDENLQAREVLWRHKDGGLRWTRAIVAADKVGGVLVRTYGAIQDTTAIHEQQAEIERLAFRDALTGLPNRAMFTRQFETELARAQRNAAKVGLILVDLDHFKDVNDTLGHDAGDALLRAVATRMCEAYRKSDTIARLGGDEFAIILPDVKAEEDLVKPTMKLMELLRRPVEHGGQVFTISASIGAALCGGDDADVAQVLKDADIALYEAKGGGRNRLVLYTPQMREAVDRRFAMLRDVRRGLAAGEFDLFYQPVVSIGQREITGFEALMRWRHQTRGVLTPDAFFAALDDEDLGPQLGDVTIECALKQMHAWLDAGVAFGRVAINISAAQFRAPNLAPKIEERLAHWGVPANRLTIEVTENVYMGWGADVVGDTVRRLHEAGVLIALDDFGTGYASLANLKQFPIDRLKIDKSFVQNAEDAAIVRAVVTLGASLGMKVVAEGVEQPEQLEVLAEMGCDQAQGYHFARAMPAEDVPDFVRRFNGGA